MENDGMKNLSSSEQQRILEILSSAKSTNWERFSFLTDTPFSNASSMKEQFDDTSNLINSFKGEFVIESTLKHHDDGSRLIFASIIMKGSTEKPIGLILHSTSEYPDSKISIWKFYQEISFG